MLSVLHQCQISTSRLTHLESAVYHRSQSDEVFSFYIPTAFERILPYWSSASRVFYMMIGFNCFLCQVVAFNDTPSVHLSVFLSVCCFLQRTTDSVSWTLAQEAETLVVPFVVSLMNLVVPLFYSLFNKFEHYSSQRRKVYALVLRLENRQLRD